MSRKLVCLGKKRSQAQVPQAVVGQSLIGVQQAQMYFPGYCLVL